MSDSESLTVGWAVAILPTTALTEIVMTGQKYDWGRNREKPEGVKIQLDYVGPGMMPDERYVKFQIGDKAYGGWMPDYVVNEENKWLKAFITTDFDDGRWLIQIPDETLTSGARIFVPREDQHTVVTSGWW